MGGTAQGDCAACWQGRDAVQPTSAPYTEYWLNPFKAAAARFAVEAISASVRDRSELDSVIAAQAREPNSGLIAMPDSFTIAYRLEIISLADRYRLPAVYPFRFFAEVGGLLSYGVDLVDNYRRVATYVDRILKGENPSSFLSRPQSSSSWSSTSRLPRRSALPYPTSCSRSPTR